jgi:hypothetical protein
VDVVEEFSSEMLCIGHNERSMVARLEDIAG